MAGVLSRQGIPRKSPCIGRARMANPLTRTRSSRLALASVVALLMLAQALQPALAFPESPSAPARAVKNKGKLATTFATQASWYGGKFHGRRTASGQRFDQNKLTAASPNLPFGTRVLVKNPKNGRTCTVVINDRGPHARGRGIDLSRAAAQQLGISGVAPVICYADRSAPGGYRYVKATRNRSGGYSFRIVQGLKHIARGSTKLLRQVKRALFAMF